MLTQKRAESILLKMIANPDFTFQKWAGKRFGTMKHASTTEKGNIAEDFIAEAIRACGYKKVEVIKGRRGDYDVCVEKNGKKLLFESKLATLDTSGAFQFNGLRYDTQYTHAFCLGVSPEKIGFLIIQKSDLGKPPHKMVSMAKNTNSGFKLTKPENALLSFNKLCTTIDSL